MIRLFGGHAHADLLAPSNRPLPSPGTRSRFSATGLPCALLLLLLAQCRLATALDNETTEVLRLVAISGSLYGWYQYKQGPTRPGNPDVKPSSLGFFQGFSRRTHVQGLIVGSTWSRQRNGWSLGWELETAHWQARKTDVHTSKGHWSGFTPLLRYHLQQRPRWRIAFGIGPRWLSSQYIANRNKSTRFQFGDLIDIGYRGKHWYVTARYLHLSNANIRQPNPKTDYLLLTAGIHF